ncbi:MAG: hypothetical protein IPJ22_11115 [Bacteroidetes bacterium]|nr:hypothetical protein [Bacteroidota bacterium]
MKHILFAITILLFLFGCKKETIEPTNGISENRIAVSGKLKSLNQFQFFYYPNTGELKSVKIYDSTTNTLVDYINLKSIPNKITFSFPNKDTTFAIVTPFNTINRIMEKKPYFSPYTYQKCAVDYLNDECQLLFQNNSFFNASNCFRDFRRKNGNYVYCTYYYYFYIIGPNWGYDTFRIEYSNYTFNKYAPHQGMFIAGGFDFESQLQHEEIPFEPYLLGLNNRYLYPHNKNLIKSITNSYGYKVDYEYEFNTQNQLVKMKRYKEGILIDEYTLDYY